MQINYKQAGEWVRKSHQLTAHRFYAFKEGGGHVDIKKMVVLVMWSFVLLSFVNYISEVSNHLNGDGLMDGD
jgi:hypothetical protein